MEYDSMHNEAPTRRDYVKYGGAVVGGGLLAGCAGKKSPALSQTTTSTVNKTQTKRNTNNDTSYEVCIPNRSCVTFDSVPETWGAATPAEWEMGLLLGQQDGFVGMFYPSYPTTYYEELGINLDTKSKIQLLNIQGQQVSVDKEIFYEANADVYLIDPNTLQFYSKDWSDKDTREIAENVGPFLGHHGYHTPGTYMDYKPWPLMDYFKVVSEVFQTPRRYDAARTFHNNLRTRIRSQLPRETPTVAMLGGGADPKAGTFHPVAIEDGGWGSKPYRDVGARDALSDLDTSTTSIDYEVLLKADPDVIVYQNRLGSAGLAPKGDEAFRTKYLKPMRGGVGANLTAVHNGSVYPASPHIQGPISTLFGMEAAAKQLYPDIFTDDLFDREQLTALTTTKN